MDEAADSLSEEQGQPRYWATMVAALLAVLLIGVVLLLFRANDAREQASYAERHTYDVLVATQSFESSVARAEAALSMFVVSGDRRDGTRYYDEWLKAGRLLTRISQLTYDNPRQAALIRRVQKLYQLRSEELARPANLATYKRQWAAFNAMSEEGSTPTASELRRTLEQVGEEERVRLAARRDHVTSVTDWSNLLDVALVTLGLMLVVSAALLGWMVIRAIAVRRDTEQRVVRHRLRADELRQAVAARTAELSDANRRLRAEAEERAAAEAQLRQMQKMDAIGQLSGGIAHDFNNMLAVVIGGLDMAKRRMRRETEDIERYLVDAMEGANRAASLTQRLLAFARQQPLEREGITIGPMIDGMSDMLSRALGEMIDIDIDVGADLWPVWTDSSQLENALLNLAVNARDAMPHGGKLMISAHNQTISESLLAGRGVLEPGDYVVIKVRDTGSGIPADVMERVLEPFFTTKAVGKGTGLGLSQIYGFVRQSGGELSIHSVEGEGATITMFLPRYSDATVAPAGVITLPPVPVAAPVSSPAAPAQAEMPGRVRVLVVEDEPRVRAATVSALKELGYDVIDVENGGAALLHLDSDPSIKLLLTDVVMPEMTGPALALAARQMRPDLNVVFATGYSGGVEDAGGKGVELLGSVPILHKPFTMAALDTKLREVLNHRAAA